MVKKLFKIIATMCFVLVTSVAFVGCFSNDNDVSERGWNKALNLTVLDKVSVTFAVSDKETVIEKDGLVLRQNYFSNLPEYLEKYGSSYYGYSYVSNKWVRSDITKEDYDSVLNTIDFSSLANYSDYEYDKHYKWYESEGYFGSYKNPTVVFNGDKKLERISAWYDDTHTNSLDITVKYKDIELTIPSV